MRYIAVIGSRDFPESAMPKVDAYIRGLPKDTAIVTGGWWGDRYNNITPTRGVDRRAALAAKEFGLAVVLVGADYSKYKRAAGFRRNPVTVGLADHVVAFWDGQSNGTRDSLKKAEALGKTIETILP